MTLRGVNSLKILFLYERHMYIFFVKIVGMFRYFEIETSS